MTDDTVYWAVVRRDGTVKTDTFCADRRDTETSAWRHDLTTMKGVMKSGYTIRSFRLVPVEEKTDEQ